MLLHNKVSWITGAAGGIGKEACLTLAAEGSKLVISSYSSNKLEQWEKELTEKGIEVLAIPLDVANLKEVQLAGKKIEEKYGKLDVLVNGAGISPKSKEGRVSVESMEESEWMRVMDVNLNGTFYCCKEAIRLMKPNKSGFIVNISSLAGKQYSAITGAHYSASKAGVIALTRQLAGELGAEGIRVNAIAPGRINTNMIQDVDSIVNEQIAKRTPLQRLGEPKEVAEVIKFLVTHSSSYLTGTTIDVNGGLAMH